MNAPSPFRGAPARLVAAALALALAGCASARVAPSAPAAPPLPTGFPASCAPGEVRVMLLGTYHFAGSSGDAVQTPAHDILSPRRQAELEALVERLARWAPDQVAVEWPYGFADSTTARYQRYVASGTTQSRNEVVQVGFRLARRLGHPAVYPIDQPLPLGNDSITALYARRPAFERLADSMMAVLQARADSASARQAERTITQQLYDANTDEALSGGNSLGMFGALLPAGEGANVGGPQLLARWYERNIIMAHYLTRIVRPETRRVLVLVGSGHVPPLRNVLHESPAFCPVSPLPYLQ